MPRCSLSWAVFFLPFSCSLTMGFGRHPFISRYGYTIPLFFCWSSRLLFLFHFLLIPLYLCKTVAYPTNSSAWFLFCFVYYTHLSLMCVSLFKWWCARKSLVQAESHELLFFFPDFFFSSEHLCSYILLFIYAVFVSLKIKWEEKKA